MNDAPAVSPKILLILTGVTGIVDAISFLALGHVFTANMTGNTVLIGFAIAGAAGVSMSRSIVALIAFMLGAVVGGRMSSLGTGHQWAGRALLIEASLFAVSAVLAWLSPGQPYPIIVSTAVAMGLRSAVVRKLAVPDLTTTVLTLTITGLAAESRFAGGGDPRWQRRLAAVLVMMGGAAAGAAMLSRSTMLPLAVCSAITGCCAISQIRSASRRMEAGTLRLA